MLVVEMPARPFPAFGKGKGSCRQGGGAPAPQFMEPNSFQSVVGFALTAGYSWKRSNKLELG